MLTQLAAHESLKHPGTVLPCYPPASKECLEVLHTAFGPAPAFWDSLGNLLQDDIVIHSCEGRDDGKQDNKSITARATQL